MKRARWLLGFMLLAFGISAISQVACNVDWTQVNADGFGDANNVGTTPTAVFEGVLYAGTVNFVTGAEVWRSSDSENWTQVNENGFGDSTNAGACTQMVFNNMLYVGTWKLEGGGELWRTSDGETWTQVNEDGFGDSNNLWAYPSAVFDGYMYVGTENFVTGGEIWRSSDGVTWTQVNENGFGDPDNVWAEGIGVFDGSLYVGTRNDQNGGAVWRSSDGVTWAQVSEDGFGDSGNTGVYPLWICMGYLYAGTDNYETGTEVWRTSDGETWIRANEDGFGNPANYAIGGSGQSTGRDCATLNVKGTWNDATGGELWKYVGGTTWLRVNVDAFGDPEDFVMFVEMVFDGKLYVGTGNDSKGGGIWAASIDDIRDACVGGDPPIFGDIVVFPTPERFLDTDLNGDGDIFDTVLRYKNLTTGVVVNTGLDCSGVTHGLDIWENTIVFTGSRSQAIRYYDIETGVVYDTGGTGRNPAIHDKWIVFEGVDGTIRLFDRDEMLLVDTGIPGSHAAVYDGVVAFQSGHPSTIWHYNIATGVATDTGAVGRKPAIYEDLIVFTTPESDLQEDLSGDGDLADHVIRYYNLTTRAATCTGATGNWPAISGDVVVFSTLEVSVSTDLNGDGRTYASVIQYLHLPSGQVTNTGQLGAEPDVYDNIISFHVLEWWSGFDWSGDGDTRDSIVLTCPVQLDAWPFATEPSADPGSAPELPSR